MRKFDYPAIAAAFDFPDAHYLERVAKVRDELATTCPEAAQELTSLLDMLPKDSLLALQELFTRSFDVQAITTLDVGYVLFGDDYKRGELLSNLKREHRLHGIDTGCELPDHLPNVLRLIAKLEDAEVVEDLVQQIVVPAIRKMIGEFDPARLERKDDLYVKHHKTLIEASVENRIAFRHALAAALAVFGADFTLVETPLLTQTADFLASISTEMKIENEENKSDSPASQ